MNINEEIKNFLLIKEYFKVLISEEKLKCFFFPDNSFTFLFKLFIAFVFNYFFKKINELF